MDNNIRLRFVMIKALAKSYYSAISSSSNNLWSVLIEISIKSPIGSSVEFGVRFVVSTILS